jgi:hypothetical protein
MKRLIRIEELAMLLMSIYALYLLDAPWWCFLLLAFGPDISMVAYAAGNKLGGLVYNLFHHKAVGLVLFAAGFFSNEPSLQMAGIILFGHSSMDRALGYGLKHLKGFKYTHLGVIGRNQEPEK